MVLQASRYIFKLLKWKTEGKKMPFPFHYINRIEEIETLKARGTTVDECLDIDVLFDAMASRAVLLIK